MLRPRYFLLLASLGGAVFCLLNAAGADLLCLTEGCRIYASYGLFGLSFYAYGAVGFLLIFLLGLLHPRPPAPALLAAVLLAALVLDILFLAWQNLFWSCFSCFTVALLLGLVAVAGLPLVPAAARKIVLGTGIVWLVFLVAVGLELGRELAFKPWPIAGDAKAPVQVFFSPDCAACRRLIIDLLQDTDMASRTAFFPIAKGETDRRRIAAFVSGGAGDRPENLLSLFDEPAEAPPLELRTRLRLLANKAALARTGAMSVPQIIAPDLLKKSVPGLYLPPLPDSLFSPTEDTGCPAFEEEPCD